jgi:hypothetical protein
MLYMIATSDTGVFPIEPLMPRHVFLRPAEQVQVNHMVRAMVAGFEGNNYLWRTSRAPAIPPIIAAKYQQFKVLHAKLGNVGNYFGGQEFRRGVQKCTWEAIKGTSGHSRRIQFRSSGPLAFLGRVFDVTWSPDMYFRSKSGLRSVETFFGPDIGGGTTSTRRWSNLGSNYRRVYYSIRLLDLCLAHLQFVSIYMFQRRTQPSQ